MALHKTVVIAKTIVRTSGTVSRLTLRVTLLQRGIHRRTGLRGTNAIAIVADNRVGGSSDSGGDVQRTGINADHRSGLTAGPGQLHQACLAAQINQPGALQQLVLTITGVVSLLLGRWWTAHQPHRPAMGIRNLQHLPPMAEGPDLGRPSRGAVDQQIRHRKRRLSGGKLNRFGVHMVLHPGELAKEFSDVVAAKHTRHSAAETPGCPNRDPPESADAGDLPRADRGADWR